MKINHALFGIGGFGGQHLRTLRRLEQNRDLKLLAVCDPAIHRYPEVLHELFSQGVRVYTDYTDLLDKEDSLTAVTIAAPIPFHYQMTKACLARNLFVYLEKPATPLLTQLDELIAQDVRLRVAVGFNMIESDWSRQIKRWIASGALGEVREIRVGACWPRADSYYNRARWAGRMTLDGEPVFDGPATNALSHLIHNVMFFASDQAEGFAAPSEIQAEMYRARPIESYDTVCLRGYFPSGCRFSVALSHASQMALPFEVHLVGTKGWAKVTQDGQFIESSEKPVHLTADIEEEVARTYTAFFDYIRGRRARPSTLLRDTGGYSLATDAMIASSGGIHPIDAGWVDRRANEGDTIYSVPDVVEAIAESLRTGRLFSEQTLPWAVVTPMVSTGKAEGARKDRSEDSPGIEQTPVPA